MSAVRKGTATRESHPIIIEPYRLPFGAPMSRWAIKYARTGATTGLAVAVIGEIPGAEQVPVPANEQLAAVVAVCAAA